MDTLLHSLPFAFISFEPWMISIVIPVAGMIFAGVLIVSGMYFQNRKREMWHQTARIALEKGQPLPAFPEAKVAEVMQAVNAAHPPQPRWRGLMIGGLINLGVGVGMFVALSQIPNARFNVGYFGAIPGFIGLGLLVGAIVDYATEKK